MHHNVTFIIQRKPTEVNKTRIINDFFRMQNTKQTAYFC